MNVRLGLEWSTSRVSVAVEKESTVIARSLDLPRFRAPDALGLLMTVLKEAETTAGELTEIRVGRGPGNYTGVRQALAVAIGLSQPDALPVRAVNSGTVLVSGLSSGGEKIRVMGDARRGLWWGAEFPSTNPEWILRPPNEWTAEPQASRLVSSEADRLSPLHVEPAYPSASDLFVLNEDQLNECAVPLYLHQAV